MRLSACILRSTQCAALIALAAAAGMARIRLPEIFSLPALRVGSRVQARALPDPGSRGGEVASTVASDPALAFSLRLSSARKAVLPSPGFAAHHTGDALTLLDLRGTTERHAAAILGAAADPHPRRWPFAHGPPRHRKMDTVSFSIA